MPTLLKTKVNLFLSMIFLIVQTNQAIGQERISIAGTSSEVNQANTQIYAEIYKLQTEYKNLSIILKTEEKKLPYRISMGIRTVAMSVAGIGVSLIAGGLIIPSGEILGALGIIVSGIGIIATMVAQLGVSLTDDNVKILEAKIQEVQNNINILNMKLQQKQ